jgi:uncharacterized membrane protein
MNAESRLSAIARTRRSDFESRLGCIPCVQSTLIVLLVLIACVPSSGRASTIEYSVETFNYPGSISTTLGGINDEGQIVGTYSLGSQQGFLYSGGTFTTVDYPDGLPTVLNSISNTGSIVGDTSNPAYWPQVSTPEGFIYANGVYTTLNYPGSSYTTAVGINSEGQVVGSTGLGFGYLYSDGVYSPIAFPGASDTEPTGINDSGEIVGLYSGADNVLHGFTELGGAYSTLDYSGGCETVLNGINDQGQILGTSKNCTDTASTGLFIEQNGVFQPISWNASELPNLVGAINDNGQFAGFLGAYVGFVASPVPASEPSSLWLLSVALVAMWGLLWRKSSSRTACGF